MDNQTGVVSTLTDGTGVSQLLGSKIVKDLVLDFLFALPAVFVGLNVTGLDVALTMPGAVGVGVADAAIRVVYRGLLRWAQSS